VAAPISLEICAGAGGQALGLEQAGFDHAALVEIEAQACATLRLNRPYWQVVQGDLRGFDGRPYHGIDLLAGGVPCPPFSKAGRQLGAEDERDMFPEAIRLVDECRPKALMLENVRGLLDAVFEDYRTNIDKQLKNSATPPAGVCSTPPIMASRNFAPESYSSPCAKTWPPGSPGPNLCEGYLKASANCCMI
jgi:DNA (cytosine-5)-methyltransferase 1